MPGQMDFCFRKFMSVPSLFYCLVESFLKPISFIGCPDTTGQRSLTFMMNLLTI